MVHSFVKEIRSCHTRFQTNLRSAHAGERGFRQANCKFCPSGTCHRRELELLCRVVEGEAGKVGMPVFLRALRNGSDTARCWPGLPKLKSSSLPSPSSTPRAGIGQSFDRSAVSDPFRTTRRKTHATILICFFSMQRQGRLDSFKQHVPEQYVPKHVVEASLLSVTIWVTPF